MSMFVVSNIIGSSIQIATLPLPVLSTLQASGLVFNTAFATLLLKEPFTRYSLIGTVLTCTGAALIATFGALSEPAHNLEQLLILLGKRKFILWMSGTLLLAIATIVAAHFLKLWSSHKHLQRHLPRTESTRDLSWSAEGLANLKRSFTANLPHTVQVRVSRLRVIRGLSYALVSGILSAHSLLVAKTAVELLVRTIVDHHNQFNRFQSWLILLALLFFALTQLYYLHLGLRLCSTSVLYPFVFCIYNIVAILDGLIYFRQGSRLSPLHAGLIGLGTVVLLAGVLALSWRLDDSTPSDPALAPNIPPLTPLTPGMGLIRTSEDSERSPILPKTRPRSSTSDSKRSADEQTPLLLNTRRPRVPALNVALAPPQDLDALDIWAELDDEGMSKEDYLASLPRTTSPFLTQRRRSRGDSTSSLRLPSNPRRPRDSSSSQDTGGDDDKRLRSSKRPRTGRRSPQPPPVSGLRRSSVPTTLILGQSSAPVTAEPTSAATPQSDQLLSDTTKTLDADFSNAESQVRRRSQSNAVRFVSQPLPRPSRWDAGAGTGPSSAGTDGGNGRSGDDRSARSGGPRGSSAEQKDRRR